MIAILGIYYRLLKFQSQNFSLMPLQDGWKTPSAIAEDKVLMTTDVVALLPASNSPLRVVWPPDQSLIGVPISNISQITSVCFIIGIRD